MKPNILYIHSHDTGRFVQPYGHAISTPNIQRLADDGVMFRQAYCAGPTCSPSRAALLTGQAAHSSGMIGLAHRGFSLSDPGQHLVHTLRQAGYHSVLAGIQHVAARSEDIGYSEVLAGKQEGAEVRAATFLRHHQNLNRPFFLDVGFFETHRLTAGGAFNHAGPEGDPRYCLPFPTMPDTPEVRKDVADYKVAATRLDDKMGTVLNALAVSGLAGNTLVICTTDHGPAFPGMKCNLQDHGIGIMLILRGPGGFLGGRVSDSLISQIDLFPTLCDLLGIARPRWLQGQSLLPLVQDSANEINDAIYAGVTYHAAYEPQRAIRTSRWKYIRRFSGKPGPILPNCDDSPSKTVWLNHGWREHRLPDEALYDLAFDPMERDNLAPEATCQPIVQNMRDRLDNWMRSTNDPLLHGPVPAPPGAVMNDPEGLSPNEPVITAR